MYVRTHERMYTRIPVYLCICVSTNIFMHKYMYGRIYIERGRIICMCVYIYVHVYIYAYVYTCVCICVDTDKYILKNMDKLLLILN
jgi:hypothetical protein